MSATSDSPAAVPGGSLARAALVAGAIGLAGPWMGIFLDPSGMLMTAGAASAVLGVVLGVAGVALADRKPASFGGRRAAVTGALLGLGGIFGVALQSALVPRHSWVALNEAVAIGDLRTIVSSEIMYASSNGGYFDRVECLQAPATCTPGYAGPAILDPNETVTGTRRGYVRTFYLGPPAPADEVAAQKLSPSSMKTFAVVAVPVQWKTTGFRSFCTDSTGVILFASDGSTPRVRDGACVMEGVRPLGT